MNTEYIFDHLVQGVEYCRQCGNLKEATFAVLVSTKDDSQLYHICLHCIYFKNPHLIQLVEDWKIVGKAW